MNKSEYVDFMNVLDFNHWTVEELKVIKNCIEHTKSFKKYVNFITKRNFEGIEPKLKIV